MTTPAPARSLNFRRVTEGIDISPILVEVRANRALWLLNQNRQRKIMVHAETNAIELRRVVAADSSIRLEECHETAETAAWAHFPKTTAILTGLAGRERGELARVMLVRLKPQGRVFPHIDHGSYYARRDRYHLVVLSAHGSDMQCVDERAVFRTGEVWCFNNKVMHGASNSSGDWRIHLIFDLLPIGRPLHFDPSCMNASESDHGTAHQHRS